MSSLTILPTATTFFHYLSGAIFVHVPYRCKRLDSSEAQQALLPDDRKRAAWLLKLLN
jgi:hypothetical protein